MPTSPKNSITPAADCVDDRLVKAQEEKPECRVLLVYAVLGVGGAETWLLALLKHLKEVENELPVRMKIDICLTGGVEGTLDDEVASLGGRLFYLAYTRKKLPAFVLGLRKILARGRYHAIHDHQDYFGGIHFLFGVGLLPPVRVVHVHNAAEHITFFSKSFLRRQTLMFGKRLVAIFATHSMGTSREILTKYGFDEPMFKRLEKGALHCGFDTGKFKGDRVLNHQQVCDEFAWPTSVKIMLFAGRLSGNYNDKNPAFAIEVAKACLARDSDIRLLMAGGGDHKIEELKAEIEKQGCSDEIRLIGERGDMARLMLGADLFLFPSVAEGLGMVAVEAQAAGLQVLASDSVPAECVVLSSMVTFKSLREDVSIWADEALRILAAPREDAGKCNLAVENSAFSIRNSAAALLDLYTLGM